MIVPDHATFKHLKQVPVVVAWKVAQHTPAVRAWNSGRRHWRQDAKNQPALFERPCLAEISSRSPVSEECTCERVPIEGREILPIRAASAIDMQNCLGCHGDPAGSKDPFGYTQEEMERETYRGAFVVKATLIWYELVADSDSDQSASDHRPIDASDRRGPRRLLLRGIRRAVIRPVMNVREVLVALSEGDLTRRVETKSAWMKLGKWRSA